MSRYLPPNSTLTCSEGRDIPSSHTVQTSIFWRDFASTRVLNYRGAHHVGKASYSGSWRNRLHVNIPSSQSNCHFDTISTTFWLLRRGGSVLTALLQISKITPVDPELFALSALVRKPYQASILADAGVTPLIFKDLDDFEVIRKAAKDHDSTFVRLFVRNEIILTRLTSCRCSCLGQTWRLR